MAETKNKKVSIEVEVKTDSAKKKLDDFSKSVNSLKNKINVNVDVNTKSVDKALDGLKKNSQKATNEMAQKFAGSFDQTAKKIKNVSKQIEKTLKGLAKEGSSIGAKFGANFANAAVKAIKARMSLFKNAVKLMMKGMVAVIKGSIPLINGAMRFLAKGITNALSGIANTAKKTITGISNMLVSALKKTVDFTINANVNTDVNEGNSGKGSSGAGSSLLNAGLLASSLKTITQAASNSLPKETGNVVAAFASKVIDAGQKALTFGKFAYQAYTIIRSNWPKIVETFKSIATAVKPVLIKGLELAANAAKSALSKGIELGISLFQSGIKKMMGSSNPFVRKLGETVNNICNSIIKIHDTFGSFKNMLETAKGAVKKFANELDLTATTKGLATLFNTLMDSVKKVCKAFQPYMVDIVKSIVNFFNKLLTVLNPLIKLAGNLLTILSPILQLFKTMFDRFAAWANLLGALLEIVSKIVEKFTNIAKKIVETVVKPFAKLDEVITNGINKLANSLKKGPEVIGKAIDGVVNVFKPVSDVIGKFCDTIKKAFTKIGGFLGFGSGDSQSKSKEYQASAFKPGNEFDKMKGQIEDMFPQDWEKFDKVSGAIGSLSFNLRDAKSASNIETAYDKTLREYLGKENSLYDILGKFGDGGKASLEEIVKGSSSLTSGLNQYSAKDIQERATNELIKCIDMYVNALEKSGMSVDKFRAKLEEARATAKPEQGQNPTQPKPAQSTTQQPKPAQTQETTKPKVDKNEFSGIGFDEELDFDINTDDIKQKLKGISIDDIKVENIEIPEVKIDTSDIKVEGKPVEFKLDTDDSSDTSLKGKIKSIDDAIQAYAKFEGTVKAVAHPVRTLREELTKRIAVSMLSGLTEDAKKAKADFDKLKESVKALKNMEAGKDRTAASIKVLGDSAKLATDKLKIVLKANTVGKLIEKMKGPADKATKKLADKVPGGKDNINLFKGALGKLALLFGGAGLFGMTKDATQEAIKYEAAIMQLNNRLGQSAALFEEFAKGKGLDLGLDRASIANYGNVFSVFVSKFESDAKSATQTTINLLEAASKTAQSTGTDMTTVMDSFRSALTGSSEAVDQYGLNMKVANLEASKSFKEVAKGVESWDKLSQAQQQQIIAMELVNQTNENFGSGMQNSHSILLKFQAVLANVKLALGNTFKVIMTAVLPPLTALLQALEVVLNKITQFVTAVLELMNIKVSFSDGFGDTSKFEKNMGNTSKSMDSVSSSADDATESAKELKGELAG